jgi:hypothetical protein
MKAMPYVKRFVLIISIFLGLIIAALIAIPFFFKDELLVAIQEQANEHLNATVAFSDVNLSIFRNFPDVSVRLSDLAVSGKAPFEGTDLVKAKEIDLTFDLMSVIRAEEPLQVQEVQLTSPEINVIILEDGRANYDITLPSEAPTDAPAPTDNSASQLEVALSAYGISNGTLRYDDRAGDLFVEALGLNHNGTGDFTLSVYDLNTQTNIESLTFASGGVGYLQEATIDLAAALTADLDQMKFTLRDNELQLNAMLLQADGYVALPNDEDIEIDLTFGAPGNDFRELLSLVPNAYTAGYESVKVTGNFSLQGDVKGIYNSNSYPAFNVEASIDKGSFQYPDLPMGVSNIATEIAVKSPDADLDNMKIDIPRFSLALGNNPLEGYFKLATPISDPALDTRIKGDLRLDDLAKAFPIEGVNRMSGLVRADVKVNTRLSTIEQENYEAVDMEGEATLNQIVYEADGMPSVLIKTATAQFSPQFVNIDRFEAELGKSDIRLNGKIDNILAYFSPQKTMRGDLTFRSNYFNADEWMSDATPEPEQPTAYGSSPEPTEEATAIFNRFDFSFDAAINELDYDVYNIKDIVAVGQIQPNRLAIERSALKIDRSDLAATGTITGVWDYLFDDGALGGNLVLQSKFLDLNPFMATEDTPASEPAEVDESSAAYEPIVIPDNINMDIRATVGRCLYTDMDLRDLKGHLIVADQEVTIENCEAKGLGGNIAIAGGYGTQDPANPSFSLKYDLQNLDFQEAFNTFNTFEKIAPIGKYIKGRFNSTMVMDGFLGPDFMPEWSSLNIDGFLQTLNAVIEGFPPLQAVGDKLNLGAFSNLTIQDTKNWFEVVDGSVIVKDFDYSYQDIDMVIGGQHGINQSMDYRIISKIPRELLEKNAAGAAAGAGLNALQAEAGKLGLNISQSEFVNVQLNLEGKLNDPKVKMKLLGTDGEKTLVEEAKETVKEEIAEQKEQLKEEAKEKVDEARQKAEQKAKEVRDSLERAAREEAAKKRKELEEKARKELEKKLGKEGEKSVDDIKKKLEDFNPLKKKKKDGN